MKAIYVDSKGILSSAIKLLDGGEWSHVGIIDGDHVVEAVWHAGVRYRRLDSLMWDCPDHTIIDVPVPNEREGLLFAHTQIMKPYDFLGVIGLPWNRTFQEDDKWWCSELWTTTLIHAGVKFNLPANLRKVGVQLSLELALSVPGARVVV